MRRNLACLAILGLGLGCSDGSSSGASIPLADLPPKLADVLCTTYRNCLGPVFEWFTNGNDCVSLTEQRIRNGTFALLQREIDAGKVSYHPSKAQACLDSLGARTCAQLLERDSEACLAALDGKVELGGDCTLDEDCKGKALCRSTNEACPGQCTPLLAAGQACAQDSNCQDGLQCSSETKLCVQPAGEGQSCENGAPTCSPGLLCLGKDDTKKTPGTCKLPSAAFASAAGSTCDPATGQLCQLDSACVAESVSLATASIRWVCMPNGTYAAGADCKPGIPDACVSGTYCKTGTVLAALSGTCTSLPPVGQECAAGLYPCQPGAVCTSGTCQNYAANGVSCTGDAMCYSGYCGPSKGCEARLPCK